MHNLLELIKKEQNIYNTVFHEVIRQVGFIDGNVKACSVLSRSQETGHKHGMSLNLRNYIHLGTNSEYFKRNYALNIL